MAANGDGEKAIWVSEFGWMSLPAGWQGNPSPWSDVSATARMQDTLAAWRRAATEWPWMGLALALVPAQPERHRSPRSDPLFCPARPGLAANASLSGGEGPGDGNADGNDGVWPPRFPPRPTARTASPRPGNASNPATRQWKLPGSRREYGPALQRQCPLVAGQPWAPGRHGARHCRQRAGPRQPTAGQRRRRPPPGHLRPDAAAQLADRSRLRLAGPAPRNGVGGAAGAQSRREPAPTSPSPASASPSKSRRSGAISRRCSAWRWDCCCSGRRWRRCGWERQRPGAAPPLKGQATS